FYKITLVSMWYGSLRPHFNPEENITMEPTVNDGSQRCSVTPLPPLVIMVRVINVAFLKLWRRGCRNWRPGTTEGSSP
ncbi:hypothetical protein XENOCAPTIV_015796, partial [Xenoophorus captivus]